MRINLLMLIVGIMLFNSCSNNSQTEYKSPDIGNQADTSPTRPPITETIDSIQKVNKHKGIPAKGKSPKSVAPQQAAQIEVASIESKEVAIVLQSEKEPIDLHKAYLSIKVNYDHVPFYLDLKSDQYFVVVNGQWDRYSLNRRSGRNQYKMGLVNAIGDELLPINLSAIHNPGIFSKDWIEIEKDDKTGLYNLSNGKVIKPQFDLLLPSDQKNQLAIAKKDNKYYSVTSDGNLSLLSDQSKIPQFMGLKKGILFRTSLSGIIQMNLTKMLGEKQQSIPEGSGVVFTPAYIKKLDIMYESFQGIVNAEDRQVMEFGTVGGISQIVDIVDIAPEVKAFFVKFHTSGMDVEEYSIDKEKVITVSSNNLVIDSKSLLSSFNNEKPFCKQSAYHVLNNSLIEIKKYAHPAEEFKDYSKIPIYTYKKISSDGSIKTLASDRFFDFTQFVKIDSSYLTDCLLKNNDPESEDYVAGEFNLLMMKHYDQEDLQIMIQEIYASYGQVFAEQKWADYFSAKSWYQPTNSDVTNQLTATDQYNIAVITGVIDQMAGREEDFIKKDALIYAETEF